MLCYREALHDARDPPGRAASAGDAGAAGAVPDERKHRGSHRRRARSGQSRGGGYVERPHPGAQYGSEHGQHHAVFRGWSGIHAGPAVAALPHRRRTCAGCAAELSCNHARALQRKSAAQQRREQRQRDCDRGGGGGAGVDGVSGVHGLRRPASFDRLRPRAGGPAAFVQLLPAEPGHRGHDHLDLCGHRARAFSCPWGRKRRSRSRPARRRRS